MTQGMARWVLLAWASFFLCGCAAYSSSKVDAAQAPHGMVYHMPLKQFQATVTVASGTVTAVALAATPAYPDLSSAYVLRHNNNLAGKNTADIEITNGLLTSSKGKTESTLGQALKDLASSFGALRTTKNIAATGSGCADGEHKQVFFLNPKPLCGVTFTVDQIGVATGKKALVDTDSQAQPDTPGVYYRLNRPYLVKAKVANLTTEAVLFSPSESATYFLPITRTLFATSEAEFGFDHGVLNHYKQISEGELTAAAKLPADILDAYFTAIGSIFTKLGTNDTNQATALQNNLALELMKKKFEACIAAVNAGDDEKILALQCNSP